MNLVEEKKIKTTFYCKQAKDMKVCQNKIKSWLKKSNRQHLYLKFNIDCPIKTYKNHNHFFKFNNA
jgi:hypothetical protein